MKIILFMYFVYCFSIYAVSMPFWIKRVSKVIHIILPVFIVNCMWITRLPANCHVYTVSSYITCRRLHKWWDIWCICILRILTLHYNYRKVSASNFDNLFYSNCFAYPCVPFFVIKYYLWATMWWTVSCLNVVFLWQWYCIGII